MFKAGQYVDVQGKFFNPSFAGAYIPCIIINVDGDFVRVVRTSKRNPQERLVPISAVQ